MVAEFAHIRMKGKRWITLLVVVVVLTYSPFLARASQESVQIHGFGGWAYARTDGNNYMIGTEDGSYNNSYFALNVSASPYERLSANVQTLWRTSEKGLEVDFDYAFAEWTFSDWLKLRIGKVKCPFGIYTEVYDVGTLRPFYNLPQAIYGVPSLVTESYFGMGITGTRFFPGGWGIQYDLFGGDLHLKEYLDQDPVQEGVYQTIAPKLHDMAGGRVIVHAPLEGLNAGVSIYSGDADFTIDAGVLGTFDVAKDRHIVYLAHADYLTDTLSVRTEYGYLQKPGESSDVDLWGWYIEAAYRFLEHWQAAALFDTQEVKLVGLAIPIPEEYPSEHWESAGGINYWFNPNFVLKLSYHYVEGNLFARPWDLSDILFGSGEFDEVTHSVIFGTQFSF